MASLCPRLSRSLVCLVECPGGGSHPVLEAGRPQGRGGGVHFWWGASSRPVHGHVCATCSCAGETPLLLSGRTQSCALRAPMLTSRRPLPRSVTLGTSQELWGDPVQVTAVPWVTHPVTCPPRVSGCVSTAGTPPSVTSVVRIPSKTTGTSASSLILASVTFPQCGPKFLCCWPNSGAARAV